MKGLPLWPRPGVWVCVLLQEDFMSLRRCVCTCECVCGRWGESDVCEGKLDCVYVCVRERGRERKRDLMCGGTCVLVSVCVGARERECEGKLDCVVCVCVCVRVWKRAWAASYVCRAEELKQPLHGSLLPGSPQKPLNGVASGIMCLAWPAGGGRCCRGPRAAPLLAPLFDPSPSAAQHSTAQHRSAWAWPCQCIQIHRNPLYETTDRETALLQQRRAYHIYQVPLWFVSKKKCY